jgi:hypothetical protein
MNLVSPHPFSCNSGVWYNVAAGASFAVGDVVCINDTGYIVPFVETADVTNLRVLGRAVYPVDNSLGGDGDQIIECEWGLALFANGDTIVLEDVGKPCYVGSNNVAYKSNNGNKRAVLGFIYGVIGSNVLVQMHPGFDAFAHIYYRDNVLNVLTEFDDVKIQVGEELQIPVVNKDSVTITNGTPVYLYGAQGHRLGVKIPSSTNSATQEVLGLATHDIAKNANGKITTFGLVRDIDTHNFDVGDELFVDGGTLTKVKPTASQSYDCSIGYCVVSHNVNGVIFVYVKSSKFIAGTTAQRPSNYRVGESWFDTTLGKPIWFTGSVWVDATGSTV